MRCIPKLTAGFTRPSSATAYTAGDIVANSATAALVVPMKFDLPGDFKSGKVLGARAVVQPASGSVVITALDLDLLVFRAAANIPFADAGFPADNGVLTLTETMVKELVAVVPFVAGAWRNQLGALTAGTTAWQAAGLSVPRAFSLTDLTRPSLVGVVQVKGAWTPGAVAQALTFDLDVEL